MYPKERKKAKKRFEYDEEYEYSDEDDDYYNEEEDEEDVYEPPVAAVAVPAAPVFGMWNNNALYIY